MIYIEIDHLVINAFIIYLRKTGKRTLTLNRIAEYGEKVKNYLNENGEHAILYLTRDLTNDFFCKYSDLFKLEETNLVVMSNDITYKDLMHKSGYLPIEVRLAFRNSENTKILFEDK